MLSYNSQGVVDVVVVVVITLFNVRYATKKNDHGASTCYHCFKHGASITYQRCNKEKLVLSDYVPSTALEKS